MNVFTYSDYRDLVRESVKERKALDSRVNFQRLAEFIRVPKSYVSKVMGGGAHFSSDQGFLVAKFLGLTPEEQRFFLVLLDLARTALAERRLGLEREIAQIQAQKRKTETYIPAQQVDPSALGLSEYYLEPLTQIVHIGLSIERFAGNLSLLAKHLGVDVSRVAACVQHLERFGIVEKQGGTYRVLLRNIHLVKDSPVYRSWRSRLRLMGLNQMEAGRDEEAYSFAAVFSTTPDVRRRIHTQLLETLRDVETSVRTSPQEQVYQLSIDLFSWT